MPVLRALSSLALLPIAIVLLAGDARGGDAPRTAGADLPPPRVIVLTRGASAARSEVPVRAMPVMPARQVASPTAPVVVTAAPPPVPPAAPAARQIAPDLEALFSAPRVVRPPFATSCAPPRPVASRPCADGG